MGGRIGRSAFEGTPGRYRLAKALRSTLIFASHDLLGQPPFPHLDLIVCHAPLACWALDKQDLVLNRFAYALAAHRYLWLVTPTTVSPRPSFWLDLDADSGLYQRKPGAIPSECLHWKKPSALLESTGDTSQGVDLYTEELQASLEEQEAAYQERLKELEAANQELESLNRLKDDFLAMASHELRTPLTSMLGYGELLRAALAHPSLEPVVSAAREMLRRSPLEIIDSLLRQSNEMAALIEDLLEVSKLRSDVFALGEQRACQVADLVGSVVEQQVMRTQRQISVQCQAQTLVGHWDERRIELVLTNLLSNALKFSPADSVVTVRVQGQPPTAAADQVLIAVSDQGCGISQQDQEHLFEPYYRARTQDQANVEGLGLGLYLAAEIVKRHAGRIWVESARGRGSTFFVCLPLVRGA